MTASGSRRPTQAWKPSSGADGRNDDRVGVFALRRPPFCALRCLLVVAGFAGSSPRSPTRRTRRYTASGGLAWGFEPLPHLPPAGVPDRPASTLVSTAAWSGARSCSCSSSTADGAAGRALSGALAVGELRWPNFVERVPRQRIRARGHRGPRAPAAGDHHDRAVRGGHPCGSRSGSAARRASRAARSRRYWPRRASLRRLRALFSAGESRRESQVSRRRCG